MDDLPKNGAGRNKDGLPTLEGHKAETFEKEENAGSLVVIKAGVPAHFDKITYYACLGVVRGEELG